MNQKNSKLESNLFIRSSEELTPTDAPIDSAGTGEAIASPASQATQQIVAPAAEFLTLIEELTQTLLILSI